MNSVFSFLQPTEPDNTPEATAALPAETIAPTPVPAISAVLPPSAAPDMSQVLKDMLAALEGFLPPAPENLPAPALILLNVNDVPVGLGDFIGSVALPLGQTELKGGRLDVVGRFILWGTSLPQVNDLTLTLQAALLAARTQLWNVGFLTFTATVSDNPQFDTTLNAWMRAIDYSWLYEYQYIFTDAAQSLIARIPIHADQEVANSPDRENTLVSDEMARWDELSAPTLLARGPLTFHHLTALAFVAGTLPTGSVTLTRSFEGATDPIQDFPNLSDFLNALAAPTNPVRHARVSFPNLTNFLTQFTPTGNNLTLGDWNLDTLPDEYQGLDLALSPPLHLAESYDRLELTYANGSDPLDQVAVFYLKLKN